MVLKGRVYDFVKWLGKFGLPLIIAGLFIVQEFVKTADFGTTAYIGLAIAVLTLIANEVASISRRNYNAGKGSYNYDERGEENGV